MKHGQYILRVYRGIVGWKWALMSAGADVCVARGAGVTYKAAEAKGKEARAGLEEKNHNKTGRNNAWNTLAFGKANRVDAP